MNDLNRFLWSDSALSVLTNFITATSNLTLRADMVTMIILAGQIWLTYSVTLAKILVTLPEIANVRITQTQRVRQERAPACRTEDNKFNGFQ